MNQKWQKLLTTALCCSLLISSLNGISVLAETIVVELIDVNKYVESSSDFYDHINHFTKPVYYNLAKDIVEVINKNTDGSVKEYGKWKIAYMKLHDFVGNLLPKK